VIQGTVPASFSGHPQANLGELEVYIRRVRPRVHSLRLAVCLAAVAMNACAGLGENFQEPKVQLDRAVIRGVGLAGGNLDLIVRVQNPNNFTLHADKLQLGIDVEGSHLGNITYEDDFAVSQNGETTLTLPLRFGWLGVAGAAWAALGYGDLPYTMKGQATLKLPGGAHTVVSFTREGRAPLTRAVSSSGSL
jgi:LEA14-like dessication related protein